MPDRCQPALRATDAPVAPVDKNEIDEVLWLEVKDARKKLTLDDDREIVDFFIDFGVSGTKFENFYLSQNDSVRTTGTITSSEDITFNSTTHSMKTTVKDNIFYDATIKIGYKF